MVASVSKLSFALAAATFSSLCMPVWTRKFLEFEPLSQEDVDHSIMMEFSGNMSLERIQRLERQLQVVYTAVPKNEHGRLSHQVVRYVLHRFFVQQHGWYVRGLEPNGVAQNKSRAGPLKDWVVAYAQDRFEEHAEARGMGLRDLAALVATLEDLISKEASLELAEVYNVLNFSLTERISTEQAKEAIEAYMMIYLMNRRVDLRGRENAEAKLSAFHQKYRGWAEANAFIGSVEERHARLTDPEGVDFNTTAGIVADMGERFGTFNDGECKDLKAVLSNLADGSSKVGRIKLHKFYNATLYTHWKFNEKLEFMRELGAVDESGSEPSVIIPNYLSAFTNCVRATSLYAVCCRNECEDLIGDLERQIAASTAAPDTILRLVAGMPSDTVPAPRKLPGSLAHRLWQMAESNGGEVHLHGRLFAQWMHHAFPMECPYPHPAGMTSPQTAAEWMERTGSAAHVSEEEMRRVVEDACTAEQGADAEEPELPWNDAEELLMVRPAATAGAHRAVFLLAPLLTAVAWLALERLQTTSEWKRCLRKVLAFSCIFAILCAAGLVDVQLFVLFAVAAALLAAFRHVSVPGLPDNEKMDKCLV